jgi:hypothetical protein
MIKATEPYSDNHYHRKTQGNCDIGHGLGGIDRHQPPADTFDDDPVGRLRQPRQGLANNFDLYA